MEKLHDEIFYTTVLALALVTAYAVSQTGSYPSSPQQSNPPQSDPSKGTPPDASQSTSPASNNPSAQTGTDKSVPQSDQPIDDQALQGKIHDQLAVNPAFSNVNVTVKDGVATLGGKVASKQDRKEAKKAVESVPGVKSVKDKLSVEASNQGDSTMPPTNHWMDPQATGSSGSQQPSGQTGTMPQSDQASTTDSSTLQTQIQTALKNEPTLSNDSITVNVTDNAIELTGTAASKKEKQTAKQIAQSYAGSRKVKDSITVSGTGNSPTTSPDKNQTPQSDQTTPK